ncbi:MAG: hypothetical protein KKB77_04835 [Bacteroidetes bacterium]|nr:hypothetical protein [Bacteroidota bacterium]
MNVAYVDDEVHGHIQAAKLGRTSERYVLGGENLTIKESFDRISKTISGRSPKLKAPHGLVKAVVKTFDFIGNVTGLQPWVCSDLIASMGIRIQVV